MELNCSNCQTNFGVEKTEPFFWRKCPVCSDDILWPAGAVQIKDRSDQEQPFLGWLVKFEDRRTVLLKHLCWSVVKWLNGDCVTIKIRRDSVAVHLDEVPNRIGNTLFYQTGEALCRRTATRLGIKYKHEDIPIGMEDPKLVSFTLAAMESETLDEYYLRLLVAESFAKQQGV